VSKADAAALVGYGPPQVGEHPNVERVRDGFAAFNRGDVEAMRPFIADDIVWHVGGDHPLSGDYRGREAVLDYVTRVLDLGGGTLKGEPLDILANDRHAGVFQRVTAERDGRRLDVVLAQALTLDQEGRWLEYWALADEQDAVDAFWAGAT
jgi:ketosteroid isomerase-like protein